MFPQQLAAKLGYHLRVPDPLLPRLQDREVPERRSRLLIILPCCIKRTCLNACCISATSGRGADRLNCCSANSSAITAVNQYGLEITIKNIRA